MTRNQRLRAVLIAVSLGSVPAAIVAFVGNVSWDLRVSIAGIAAISLFLALQLIREVRQARRTAEAADQVLASSIATRDDDSLVTPVVLRSVVLTVLGVILAGAVGFVASRLGGSYSQAAEIGGILLVVLLIGCVLILQGRAWRL